MRLNTKKLLCLLISSVLFTSNIQVFAQEVQVTKAISANEIKELDNQFAEVGKMLSSLRNTFNKKLLGLGKLNQPEYYKNRLFFENIGLAQEKIEQLDKAYINLLDKTYSYTDYIFEEEGKTALERLTYKYLGTPGLSVKNYHLEEGARLEKIRGILEGLEKTWFDASTFNEIMVTTKNQENVMNDLVTYLEQRLTEVHEVFNRTAQRNEEIYINNTAEIFEKHITQDDVLKRAIRVIPQEDREAIGLFLKSDNLKASKIELAKGIRRYAEAIGNKNIPSVFNLLKRGVYNTAEAKEFNKAVKSKYENLLDDFPIFHNGRYISPQWTIRRMMRSAPLMVLGTVLTISVITEVRNDNSFDNNSFGIRKMKNLKSKIEKGDASFTEALMFYSDDSSFSAVNKDPNHLINAISLALATKQAEKDFDIIAPNIESELKKKYSDISMQEVQDNFNLLYDLAVKKIEDDII